MDICGKQQLYLFGVVALLSLDKLVVMVVFLYQVRILSMVIVSYQALYQYNTDTSNAHLANVMERLCVGDTSFNPVCLFNHLP